ncbi:endonuclease/exonuclease/phosphatase family protein [Belnapia sp. F-4-1]|uniref:endonuclease/exonuclease/phosphatase family protein n=1 Tax=Belnapia sp. F-4-1 TaxID=1545443 RepID=UPI00068C96E1|nr:endonuclease/exonuclease/phosphatase family protein [Belnapia sp. F-4-1]
MPIYTDRVGWSEEEYERKIAWTASNIVPLRPDILGFQELWHRSSLNRALEVSGLSAEYDLLAPPNADGGRIVNAAIFRKRMLDGEPEWISDFPDKFRLHSSGDDPQTPAIEVQITSFSRPVLHFRARVRQDHDPVHVYVCHVKSKAPTQVWSEEWFKKDEVYKPHRTNLGAALSTIRRTAEASALRFILTKRMKDSETPVAVLGDVNDGQHSNTVNILTEQPRYLVGDSRGGGDTALYTAQTLQEYRNTRDVYYTHIHQDIMESLDHILVSQEFYDNSRKRLWIFDGMTVRNDHLDSADHKADGTSDHGIVCARFRYRPAKAL